MARHCPDCGDPLSQHGVCGSCGYGKKAGSGKAPFDPDWWRCADEFRGQRCALAGALSHSTHGGGPWYCADHFSRGKTGPKSLPVGGFQALRGSLQAVAPDPEAIAERLALQSEVA